MIILWRVLIVPWITVVVILSTPIVLLFNIPERNYIASVVKDIGDIIDVFWNPVLDLVKALHYCLNNLHRKVEIFNFFVLQH